MNEMETLTDTIFRCTRCGNCCQGETTVSLDLEDQERMCLALKDQRQNVAEKYWRISGSTVQMKVVGGHCIFYNDGCTVHTGRPWRCAEWPLHPSILRDKGNFTAISASCPGINPDISYEDFCDILQKILKMNLRASC